MFRFLLRRRRRQPPIPDVARTPEVASALAILDHIARHEADVGDNDPEFAVLRQDAEAVLKAAGLDRQARPSVRPPT